MINLWHNSKKFIFDVMAEMSSNLHPYEREITAFIENPRVEFEFDMYSSIDLKEMNDVYVWVETESQLKELADALSKERFFAVDTEQHSLRCFLGFTALIQVLSILILFTCSMSICCFLLGCTSDHVFIFNLNF